MSLLDELYQDLILEHYRRPRHHGALAGADVVQEGINPSCGDELTLYLRATDDEGIEVSFEGEGCAISQAAASLMSQAVTGGTRHHAAELSAAFQRLVRGEKPGLELGDLQVFTGVAKLPARVKCALLPWKTLDEALARLDANGAADPAEPAG